MLPRATLPTSWSRWPDVLAYLWHELKAWLLNQIDKLIVRLSR